MKRPADGSETLARPHFADVGVIGLVPTAWGGHWQPRHHVLTRLARYFHVVWMNPARGWRESWLRRPGTVQDLDLEDRAVPGFSIYQPEVWLPQFHRPRFLDRLTTRERLRRARRTLMSRGCRRIVLYLWRPRYASAIDLIKHDATCYHIDDEYSFCDVEQPLNESEARLISRVGQVFIHSPALLEKKGHLNPRTLFLPNGVDYGAYATPCPEPDDLRDVPRPRVGYIGVIKRQLDFVLLLALAERHPAWSFVFVGPEKDLGRDASLVRKLAGMANVYFLGRKAVSALPAYTQHMDVCVLCYVVNDYTKFIYPLKLHEYLASGRPVVGAPIRSLEGFSRVITLARTPEEWSRGVAEALSPSAVSGESVAARRRVAQTHDWAVLVRRIAGSLCALVGTQYAAEFEERFADGAADDRTHARVETGLAGATDLSHGRPGRRHEAGLAVGESVGEGDR